MKTMTKHLLVLCSLLCGGTVFAQAHTLTYTRIARPVDSTITIKGDSYTMVRIPVLDMVTRNRYSVIFPANDGDGQFTSAFVNASHKPDGFAQNMTIDGFPARVDVIDGVFYLLNTNFISGGYDFTVTGSATVTVSIDLGETIMTISNTIAPELTNVAIGESANAVPFAEWLKYRDQVDPVEGLDHWIDNIRIQLLYEAQP